MCIFSAYSLDTQIIIWWKILCFSIIIVNLYVTASELKHHNISIYIENLDCVFKQILTNLSNDKCVLSEIHWWTCYSIQAAIFHDSVPINT